MLALLELLAWICVAMHPELALLAAAAAAAAAAIEAASSAWLQLLLRSNRLTSIKVTMFDSLAELPIFGRFLMDSFESSSSSSSRDLGEISVSQQACDECSTLHWISTARNKSRATILSPRSGSSRFCGC